MPARRLPGPRSAGRGSLVVAGAGITGIGQITLEAVECMRSAETLYYCVVDPIAEIWIRQQNPNAISLSTFYQEGKRRATTYAETSRTIVAAVRAGARVCVVYYGHPGVLVDATHQAIRTLRRSGYSARMLPGVSTDACLYADLGLDPGQSGMQSFEATEFLLSRRRIDPSAGLMLWQIGVLGVSDSRLGVNCRPERLQTLVSVLRKYYPARHQVVVYYAATFPADPPVVQRVALDRLPRTVILPMALLYVPALAKRKADPRIRAWFADRSRRG